MKKKYSVLLLIIVQVAFGFAGIQVVEAVEPGPVILCGCEITDWALAKLGLDGLLKNLKLGAKPLICVTGGALGGTKTSPDQKRACALALLEAGAVDVINLSAGDLEGKRDALVQTITQSKIPFLSACFHFKDGKPTPWKEFTVIEHQGKKIVCIGLASRRPSQNLPGRALSPDIDYIEPEKALANVLPRAEKEGDSIIILADVRPVEAMHWKERSSKIAAILVSGKAMGTRDSETSTDILFAPPGGKSFLLIPAGNAPLRLIALPNPKNPTPRFRSCH